MKAFYLICALTGIVAVGAATYKFIQSENFLWLALGFILFFAAMKNLWSLRKLLP